jgi:hypothetical protein
MNHWIRVLIPSWRFFDGTVDAAVLYHRLSDDGTTFSDWKVTIPRPPHRTLGRLFLNAHENYLFACHALIEYLKNDLTDEVDASPSIALVKNLVEFEVKPVAFFQFKIVCESVDYTSEVFHR